MLYVVLASNGHGLLRVHPLQLHMFVNCSLGNSSHKSLSSPQTLWFRSLKVLSAGKEKGRGEGRSRVYNYKVATLVYIVTGMVCEIHVRHVGLIYTPEVKVKENSVVPPRTMSQGDAQQPLTITLSIFRSRSVALSIGSQNSILYYGMDM